MSLTSFPPPTSPHSSPSTTDREKFHRSDKPEACQASQASQAHEARRPRGTLQTPGSHFSLPHVVPKLERIGPCIEPEESRHSSALGSNPKCGAHTSEIPHQVDIHIRSTDFTGVKAEEEGDEGALGPVGSMSGSHPRCKSTSFVRSRKLRQLDTQLRNPHETLRDPVDSVDPVAAELGLDQNEEHLLWLVDAAASVELPEGWITFPDENGCAVYYHEETLRYTKASHVATIQGLR